MIRLYNRQSGQHAQIEAKEDGSVVVQEGSSLNRMKSKTFPPALVNEPTGSFVTARVEEFLARGFYFIIDEVAGSQGTLTFKLRGTLELEGLVQALHLLKLEERELSDLALVESSWWVIGGASVALDTKFNDRILTCEVPAAYAAGAGLLFALTAGTDVDVRNLDGNPREMRPLIAEAQAKGMVDEAILERLYALRVLQRPIRIGARQGNRRTGLRMTM
ncbi:hypothetical protein [Rhodanobacter denitrificans]|uniref:hypothetical protein n=1 Tax=Rhodanobacter denitrificans TaxID=666685 RepID=UPI001F3A9554|nr:hypothetical protein [Rhodanobacter denitrificans]UJJ60441.1 hypothetical protein LRK55_18550 [Rhodanobacter denitrificans]